MSHKHVMVPDGPEMTNPGLTHYIITQRWVCRECGYPELRSRNGDPMPKEKK